MTSLLPFQVRKQLILTCGIIFEWKKCPKKLVIQDQFIQLFTQQKHNKGHHLTGGYRNV